MKIKRKLYLGYFSCAVLLSVIIAAVLLYQNNKISQSLYLEVPSYLDRIEKTTQLDRLMHRIRYDTEVLTQSVRNYIFTQDIIWKERHQEIEPHLFKSIQQALVLSSDRDKDFLSMCDQSNQVLMKMDKKVFSLVEKGNKDEALALIQSSDYQNQKSNFQQGIKKYIETRGAYYNKALEASTQMVQVSVDKGRKLFVNSIRIIVFFSLVFILIAFGMCEVIARSFLTPIKKFRDITNQIGEGNSGQRIEIHTGDELEDLADSFNKMLEYLTATTTSISTLNKEILERRKVETELETANCDLLSNEKAIRSMFNDLKKAHDDLKETQTQLVQTEKMAALGQLCAGVAHEIKNPLAIILLSICELEGRLAPLEERDLINIRMVKDAVDKTNKVVLDLLNFSRYTTADLQATSLYEVIDVSLSLSQNRAKLKTITFEKEYATKEDVIICADNILLEQVFLNLFTNAIDAIDKDGTIKIKIYWEQVRSLKSTDKENEERVVVDVIDSGCGISENNITRIFEPFFTTKDQGKGTGLGLSTVYMIIEKHYGTIEVDSSQGRGTKITIKLPFNPEAKLEKGEGDGE